MQYNRNIKALGKQGQESLKSSHIGIIGAGGHGFNLILMLSHLGIGNLTIIDNDTVEESNLNRLLGLGRKSIGKYKVHVLKKKIYAINPKIKVTVLPYKVENEKSLIALKDNSLIVGASDSESCRLTSNDFSVQYMIPFIDLGCGINTDKKGNIQNAGGQIRFILPGITPCLLCINGIDLERAKQESLSENELNEEIERGYIKGVNIPQPSLISLNMTICSLAVTQIVFFLTGLQPIDYYLYYDFLKGSITKIDAERKKDCIVCSKEGLLGKGDTIKIINKPIYPKARANEDSRK